MKSLHVCVNKAPVSVSVEPINPTTVAVNIVPHTDANGVDSYKISLKGGETKKCIPESLDKPICEITGLEVGTEYSVVIRACNTEAPDDFCSTEMSGSGWTRPNKPESLKVEGQTKTSLTVTFEAPAVNTGIGLYKVYQDGYNSNSKCSIQPEEQLKCQLTDLKAGTKYGVKVRACIDKTDPVVCSEDENASGWTQPNGQLIFGLQCSLLADYPASVTVEPDTSSSVLVAVQPPTEAQGIVSYKASIEGGDGAGKACEVTDVNKPSCVISGLEPATKYTVRVVSCVDSTNPVVCGEDTTGSGWTRPNTPNAPKFEDSETDSIK
uniref:Fibronectin type-III domain-containing protein n=1 Tax=Mesocestoides corti TaxID=53468 RepID=A0A5K3G0R3_MESCO